MRKAIPLLVLLLTMGLFLVSSGCSKKDDPVTPPAPACAITMTSPGEIEGQWWFTGSPINIRWDRTTGGDVKIDLFKGADRVGTITDQTDNDGYHPWNNSSTFGQVTGEDYSIEVSHLTSANCQNQTNTFKMIDISNCFVTFPWSEPGSIPDLEAGNNFLITWESGHTTGFVDLELWYEPLSGQGDFLGYIEEHLVDSGTYTWVVDSLNRGTSEGYRLKIRDDREGIHQCYDRSVPFKITDDVNCTIEVLGISQGQTYPLGSNLPISFAFENSTRIVSLHLYTGDLRVPSGVITPSFDTQNGTATFNWTVDTYGHNLPVFDRFNIRAFDVDDEYCVGASPDFTISQ